MKTENYYKVCANGELVSVCTLNEATELVKQLSDKPNTRVELEVYEPSEEMTLVLCDKKFVCITSDFIEAHSKQHQLKKKFPNALIENITIPAVVKNPDMRSYDVTFTIQQKVTVSVIASNESEAIDKARKADWEDVHIAIQSGWEEVENPTVE